MKIVVNYLNFILHIEVKAKSKYRILNFVFHFIKNTKWPFGYTDSKYLLMDTSSCLQNDKILIVKYCPNNINEKYFQKLQVFKGATKL